MRFKTNDACIKTAVDFAIFPSYLTFLLPLMAESKCNGRKAEIKNGKKYLNNLENHCHKHKALRSRPEYVFLQFMN
jgi:hypothetical protein